MPEALGAAFATPGLFWLVSAISVAGIIRGFTGFGTALIFVPVAGIFLPPEQVILLITLTGIASTAALLPHAWGHAARAEVATLVLPAYALVPLGVWLMTVLPADKVRWAVTAIASVTLGA